MSASAQRGGREWIEGALRTAFSPESLRVEDESHLHAGHPGAVGGARHFRVWIVSPAFRGQTRIQRHRRIYAVLAEAMGEQVHALAIRALTPDEAASESTHG